MSDQHNEIGNRAFAEKLGADWISKAMDYGGANLEIDFERNLVKIQGSSNSLNNRGIPYKTREMVIREAHRFMNQS